MAKRIARAGVVQPIDYAIFQNHGYVGSTELAANLFRTTQAEEKLRRERVKGKEAAHRTHREVGVKVRKTIQELGGTMPEDLPTIESEKKLQAKQREERRVTFRA